jgi:hypothetical protein
VRAVLAQLIGDVVADVGGGYDWFHRKGFCDRAVVGVGHVAMGRVGFVNLVWVAVIDSFVTWQAAHVRAPG